MICCMFCLFFLLIILRPPRSTLTDTLLPYTTLFRSLGIQTVVIPGRPGFDQRPHHTHARLEGEFMRASRLFARNVCLSKAAGIRSEEHTSELQSLMRISYAVFCLKKKTEH